MSQAALKQALSRGAVGFIAQQLSRGANPFTLINELRSAYPGMNPTEYGQVYSTGKSAYYAAQEVTGPLGSGIASLETIPVNPGLWKGQPTGNQFRFQTLIEYQIPGESSSRFSTLNINTLQNLSAMELLEMANAQFDALVNRRSPRMPQYMPAPPIVINVSVIDLERQF